MAVDTKGSAMTPKEIVADVYGETGNPRRAPTDEEIEIVIRDGTREEVGALMVKFGCAHLPLLRRFAVLDRALQAQWRGK
jgi:hypothetical protein